MPLLIEKERMSAPYVCYCCPVLYALLKLYGTATITPSNVPDELVAPWHLMHHLSLDLAKYSENCKSHPLLVEQTNPIGKYCVLVTGDTAHPLSSKVMLYLK